MIALYSVATRARWAASSFVSDGTILNAVDMATSRVERRVAVRPGSPYPLRRAFPLPFVTSHTVTRICAIHRAILDQKKQVFSTLEPAGEIDVLASLFLLPGSLCHRAVIEGIVVQTKRAFILAKATIILAKATIVFAKATIVVGMWAFVMTAQAIIEVRSAIMMNSPIV